MVCYDRFQNKIEVHEVYFLGDIKNPIDHQSLRYLFEGMWIVLIKPYWV